MFATANIRPSVRFVRILLSSVVIAQCAFIAPLSAETISDALSRAYATSPDLNQQRAGTRAIDENLPKSLAGYRPTVTASVNGGLQHIRTTGPGATHQNYETNSDPRAPGLTVTETLYNGWRTPNSVSQSESLVLQARQTLRLSEQNVLAAAAAAYMNVLRDTAILSLQKNNIEVLQEQLKQTKDRFQVGEVTRTDVAQAEASLAQGQAAAFSAQSNLQSSLATYRQLIGVDPKNLAPAKAIDGIVPTKIDDAINAALTEHPSVQAALYNVDALALAVKINQGQLLPTVSVSGSIAKNYDYSGIPDSRYLNGSVIGTISVPLYEGGAVYASVRQAKEQLSQAQLQADLAREQIRAGVVSTWGNFQNTKFVIDANKSAVRAAEIALNGVREEAKVGQRTTLDVLNAQQTLLQARVSLVTSQRDQVVNSYSLTQSVGRLTAERLGLKVTTYDPTVHYEAVRDKWIGLRTPDGN